MKKPGIVLLTTILSTAWLVPPATAAGAGDGVIVLAQATAETGDRSQPRGNTPSRGDRVTHAELARILVNILGLSRQLPVGATAQQHFAALMDNRITVPGGWVTDATVTKGDLAVAIVKSMKAMGEVVEIDTDDSRAAIAWLRENGVPIDSIGGSVASLRPLADTGGAGPFDTDTDPISRREVYSTVDEPESGADAARAGRGPEAAAYYVPTVEEVVAVMAAVARPERPTTPPTPFRP